MADEAVGVLVGAALPGMVRRRKINLYAQDVIQFLVAMKLGAIIRRDDEDVLALIRLEREPDHRLLAELGGHDAHVFNGDAVGFDEFRSSWLLGFDDAHIKYAAPSDLKILNQQRNIISGHHVIRGLPS